MANASLPAQTNLAEEKTQKLRRKIPKTPFYAIVLSRSRVASFIWAEQHLKLLRVTDFADELDSSFEENQTAGRRRGSEENGKQGMESHHSKEDVDTKDLLRLHLKQLKETLARIDLPPFHEMNLKIFCGSADRAEAKVVMKSESYRDLRYLDENIFGSASSTKPSHPSFKEKILERLAEDED